ncbi:MAG: hypothetical protein J6Y78_09760 [Paludibacteraceae bacterium]|nr:hypothetical protein [Paludibacteraceae bacterium]
MILDDEGKIKEVVEKSLIEFYSTRNTSPKMPIESKLVNAFVNSIFNDSLVDVYNKLKNYMSGDGKEFGFLKSYSSDIMYVPRKYWYIVAYAITRKDKTLFELISRAFYDNENVTVDYGDPDGTYTDEELLTDTGEHTDIVLGLITVMFESFAYNNPVDITKYPRGSVAWEDWLEKGDVFDHLISIIHPARISVKNVPVLYGNKTLKRDTIYDTDVNFTIPWMPSGFDEEYFNNMALDYLLIGDSTKLPLIKYTKTKIDDNTIRHDMTFQGLTVGVESNPYDIGPVEYQASSMSYPIVYPFSVNGCGLSFKSYKTYLLSSTSVSGTKLIKSSDGITWTNVPSTNGIKFTNGVYSEKQNCYVFIDGMNVYKMTTGEPQLVYTHTSNLNKIIYEKNRFVIIGDSSTILTSADGESWVQRRITISTRLYGIAYSPDKDVFVAVGGSSGFPGQSTILTSSDTVNWNIVKNNYGSNYYTSVCYSQDKGLFVVTGGTGSITITSDLANWTQTVSGSGYTSGIYDIIYCEDKKLFIGVGYAGGIAKSSDAITWTYSGIHTTGIDLNYIFYSPIRKIFITGTNQTTLLAYHSEDGETWEQENQDLRGIIEGIDLSSRVEVYLDSDSSTYENLAVPQSLYEDNNNRVRLVIDTILPQE